jgi:hypothetical protein
VPRHASSLVALLLACSTAAAQQVSPRAREVVQTIRELRTIGLPNAEEIGSGPPPKVPGLLRQLNHQLKVLITKEHPAGCHGDTPVQMRTDFELPDW